MAAPLDVVEPDQTVLPVCSQRAVEPEQDVTPIATRELCELHHSADKKNAISGRSEVGSWEGARAPSVSC
jgi:hypothetical protein